MEDNPASKDGSASRVELSQLWTRAYPMVFAFIRSTVRDFHSCEDIMQEVATAVAEKFDQYDRGRPFSAWVIGIARNKTLMYLRSETSDRHVFDEKTVKAVALGSVEIESELPARQRALQKCSEKLAGRSRKIVEMRYVRGEKPAAIAKSSGMTSNAVSILLHRIRKALKDCIEGQIKLDQGILSPSSGGD